MTVVFERYRNGHPTGELVWVDEAEDITGEGPEKDEARRIAASIVTSMTASTKWKLADLDDVSFGNPEVPKASPAETASAPVAGPEKPAVSVDPKPAPKVTQADVRTWAQARGIEVNVMGRVPQKIIDQYLREA